LGLKSASFTALLEWTLNLRTELGVPHTLEAIAGMSEQNAINLAPLAHADAALAGNPKSASIQDLSEIMSAALAGRLVM
jgi:alcohol dehydrogenase class IV